jgi:heptaprenyl diphosphate synthase
MTRYSARPAALLGMLSAAAIVLSAVEGALPAMPFLPPGAKAGFSNIIVMHLAAAAGLPAALAVAMFKAAFALLTRGAAAGLMSLCGGCVSACLLYLTAKGPFGYVGIGIAGGAAHNMGQLAAAALIIGGRAAMAYAPALLICGGIAGSITGAVLWAADPVMNRFFNSKDLTFYKSEGIKP